MSKGRVSAVEITNLPYARGRAALVSLSTQILDIARSRVSEVALIANYQVVLPIPSITVMLTKKNTGTLLTASSSATTADEWAWSIDGSGQVGSLGNTVEILSPASLSETTRTFSVSYRVGLTWSDASFATITVPKHRYWVGFEGDLVPTLPTRAVPPVVSTRSRGRVAQVTLASNAPINPVDPITLEPATGVPSQGLFFELPTSQQIADSTTPNRMILAHYYGPQPGAFSNASSDYFETGYLPVNGEGGIHAAYGGLMRDRPMLGAPFATTPVSWQRNMQGKEITAAKQAGIDGFFVNIMGSSGDNWDRYIWMAQEASANYPGFKVVPMVDATTTMALSESVDVCADRVNQFLSMNSAWRLSDGRYVAASFKMEGAANRSSDPKGPDYWLAVSARIQALYGKSVAWVGAYNNINLAVNYASVQYAAGQWGPGADPGIYNKLTNYGSAIKGRGEKFLFGLWAQDVRPRSDLFDEARNSEALRAGFDAAIRQDADIIQLCTWSDHTEGSMFRPTVKQGYSKLDIAAYRIVKWKTGKYPRILRDALYLTYRNQMLNATITGGQTRVMAQWARTNRSETRESVEVLTYFTAPANVTLNVGISTYSYVAPAGEYAYLAPLEPGEVSATAVRSSTQIAKINAPIVIKSTTVNQDREYVWFSSIRGTSGQYDPTPGSPQPTGYSPELVDLTPSGDTPTFTYAALSSGAATTIAGSAGWQREKRVGMAETAVGGAQSSTATLDLTGSTRFRYPGILKADGAAANAGQYVTTPLKTGGGAQNAYMLMNVDFITPVTDTIQFRLLAPVTNPRFGLVLVNGRRVQATPVIATATAGAGYSATLTFPTAAKRRIKIYGLNHNLGQFGGIATGAGAITKPTSTIQRRVVILGDSFANGSTGVSALETFCWDVARGMNSDDIVQVGIGGTGFVNDGGDANGRFINRVPDVLALKPDVLLIVGGANDSNDSNLSSRIAELLDATASVAERWVISNSSHSTGKVTIKNAVELAGVPFIDMSDYKSYIALSDGTHPTWQGHRDFATTVLSRMDL